MESPPFCVAAASPAEHRGSPPAWAGRGRTPDGECIEARAEGHHRSGGRSRAASCASSRRSGNRIRGPQPVRPVVEQVLLGATADFGHPDLVVMLTRHPWPQVLHGAAGGSHGARRERRVSAACGLRGTLPHQHAAPVLERSMCCAQRRVARPDQDAVERFRHGCDPLTGHEDPRRPFDSRPMPLTAAFVLPATPGGFAFDEPSRAHLSARQTPIASVLDLPVSRRRDDAYPERDTCSRAHDAVHVEFDTQGTRSLAHVQEASSGKV